MKVIYDKRTTGIRILRCFGEDGQAELPDQIDGYPVTELGPYVFSRTVRRREPGEAFLAEVFEREVSGAGGKDVRVLYSDSPNWEDAPKGGSKDAPKGSLKDVPKGGLKDTPKGSSEDGQKDGSTDGQKNGSTDGQTDGSTDEQTDKQVDGQTDGLRKGFGEKARVGRTLSSEPITGGKWADLECLEDGTPVLCDFALHALTLPSGLKKIGAYACYNCENLEELTFSWELSDLGAGLFTGCHGIRRLKLYMPPGRQSCLKEILAELRQTLQVTVLDGRGQIQAKLLFPEYYEEAIENTPARILTQEMHGCGHRYRNAFNGKEFQYLVYDKLFPHIQVQERPDLVMDLVLGRLMYPVQLQKERREIYQEYAAAHGREIVRAAEKEGNMDILKFAANAPWCSSECLEEMLEEGSRGKDAQVPGILMDIRYERRLGEAAAGEERKGYGGDKEKETGNPDSAQAGAKNSRRRRFEL